MHHPDAGTCYLCITCHTPLTPGALRQQSLTGRLVCHRCRLAEMGIIEQEPAGIWHGWGDILALAALCGLAWAALYFLG